MTDEKIYANGLIVKRHPNAPDIVKANLSFKMEEFISFAREHHKDGWLNVQVKESKGGKLYAELDTFTPSKREEYDTGMRQAKQAAQPDFEDEDLPF